MLRQLFLLAFVAMITPIPTNSCEGEAGAENGWDRITRRMRSLNRHRAKHLENPNYTQVEWDQTWDKIKLRININIL